MAEGPLIRNIARAKLAQVFKTPELVKLFEDVLYGVGTILPEGLQQALAALQAHIGKAAGAHAASAISNAPAGDVASTTVQDAVNELDTKKQDRAGLAAPTGAGLVGHQDTTVADLLDSVRIADFSSLRDYEGAAHNVYITGYSASSAPSGIAGPFTRDDSDTTSPDDGATVIVTANGVRYKRTFSGPMFAEWFGAKGDNATDDAAAFNAALIACAKNGAGVVGTRDNAVFRINSQLTVPTGATLRVGDGSELLYYGTGTAVRVEPAAPDDASERYSSDQVQFARRNRIYVRKNSITWHTGGGASDTSSIGIQMVNQRYSGHELGAQGFYIGVDACGFDTDPDTATVYAAGGAHVGNIYTVYLRNNFTQLRTRRNGTGGYANQNTVLGRLFRNDGAFTKTGSRGFDGSDGANGWSFIGINSEGNTIEQIYRFGGPYNLILGGRFENATDGMVKVLAGGGVTIRDGYLGTVGKDIVSCDAGGSWAIFSPNGNYAMNGLAANAVWNSVLTGTSGYFFRFYNSGNAVLSEADGGSNHRWDFFTTAGKYDATLNPTGLNNPATRLNAGTRQFIMRPAGFDGVSEANSPRLSWADGTYLTLTNYGLYLESLAFNKALLLKTIRTWVDAFGMLRGKNGANASSDTDGFPFGQKVGVPATATDAGAPGQWAADDSFLYTYTGDGTTHKWRRVAHASW